MKKLLLLFICFIFANIGFAQSITFSGGLSFSSMTKESSLLNGNFIGASAFLGTNYLNKKYYHLSSQIGYIKIGGKGKDVFINNAPLEEAESWDYLHLNTTFRLNRNIESFLVYIGIGPKVDVLLGKNEFKNNYFNEANYKLNTLNWGGKFEIGIQTDINKLNLGINFSYHANFKYFAYNPLEKFNNRNFLCNMVVSYRL